MFLDSFNQILVLLMKAMVNTINTDKVYAKLSD